MEFSPLTILIILNGVALGWFLSFVKSRFEIKKYKKELQEYKEHLNRHMSITNDGNKNKENDLDKLKKRMRTYVSLSNLLVKKQDVQN